MGEKRKFTQCREAKGYSQIELANLMSVTQQSISSWEVGRTTPKPYQMKKLAELLETEMDVLFYDVFYIKK